MIIDTLRDLLSRDPFRPFRVRVSSGSTYEVRNPDLAVPLKSQLFLAVPNSDKVTFIPYLYIAAVDALSSNGHPPRRHKRR